MSIESERTTRKKRIDPRLTASGWVVTAFNAARPVSDYTNHAIEEYPTANGPVDYALVLRGRIVGVIEAKKVTLGTVLKNAGGAWGYRDWDAAERMYEFSFNQLAKKLGVRSADEASAVADLPDDE